MTLIERQREADAAFFEDWSTWANLDDQSGRYRCDLRLGPGWIGGPYFEIVVPNRDPAMRLCRAIAGARQRPGLHGLHHVALSRLNGTWYVPAEHWSALRAALPSIKRSIVTWLARCAS